MKKCEECGKTYEQNFLFCIKCGVRLKSDGASQPVQYKQPTPEQPKVTPAAPEQPRVQSTPSAITGISGAKGKYIFSGSMITLGRSRSSQIFIDNNAIGRYHALIENVNGDWFITDKESKNFTYINGQKIQPNARYKLANGMKLRFANEEFTVV